jgi:hypothetical protein
MPERSVSLDLRAGSGQAQSDLSGSSARGTGKSMPDDASVARFAQSLRSDLASSGVSPSIGPAIGPSGPLGLFGTGGALAKSEPGSLQAKGIQDRLVSDLQSGVKRLLVAEDQRSLRLDLDAAVFPGVVVRVFEDSGAWVAEFTSRDVDSFKKLSEPAQDMATQLASALARDAIWRVVPQGLESAPELDTVEAFASAPGGLR